MDIKSFYQYSQQEIVTLFREFLEKDFFLRYSQWRNCVSVVITGSVPSGRYDKYSDIDANFFVVGDAEIPDLLKDIKEYKVFLRKESFPVQLHSVGTFSDLEAGLINWNKDGVFREHSRALIVQDPRGLYRSIQEKIYWYPEEVLREKFQWLFAEVVFSFQDRFIIAVARKDVFYVEMLSIQILKLLGNALLLLKKQYPAFDKHLFFELRRIGEDDFCSSVEDIFSSRDLLEKQRLFELLLSLTEERLIESGSIERKTRDFWIHARPQYRVDLSE